MSVPKWTEERTSKLLTFVGDIVPVTQAIVAEAAEALETSARSVSSKLRKMGLDVEAASTATTKAYTDEQEAILANFVESNSGQYTYAEIAEIFEDGAFSAKSIQGKVLSMQLTEHVKAAPPKESTRTYSDEEEATFVKMAKDGAYIEAIADALNRPVNSIRGKALSLLRSGVIDGIPSQAHSTATSTVHPLDELGDSVAQMTVAEIAEKIGKTPRGVKTMLTRKGVTASDYDGAAKRKKADESAE